MTDAAKRVSLEIVKLRFQAALLSPIPFKSFINSNIVGYLTTISSVSIVCMIKPLVINKCPISIGFVNGDTCGEIPPLLSSSANCNEDLKFHQKKKLFETIIWHYFILFPI